MKPLGLVISVVCYLQAGIPHLGHLSVNCRQLSRCGYIINRGFVTPCYDIYTHLHSLFTSHVNS